jgi:hypothetical protein
MNSLDYAIRRDVKGLCLGEVRRMQDHCSSGEAADLGLGEALGALVAP